MEFFLLGIDVSDYVSENRDSARRTTKSYDVRDDARANRFKPMRQYRDYKANYNADRNRDTAILKELPNNDAELNKNDFNPYDFDAAKRTFKKSLSVKENIAPCKTIANYAMSMKLRRKTKKNYIRGLLRTLRY